jgi:hypothetical protein
MKHILLKLLILSFAFLNIGCIEVEDGEDTAGGTTTDYKTSTANITSGKTDFTLVWQKNTKNYGQLEIINNPSVVNPIAIIIADKKQVSLNCEFKKNLTPPLKEYSCVVSDAGKIGSFPLILPYNEQLLIIERKGNTPDNDFEVLSEFFIYPSHGEDK